MNSNKYFFRRMAVSQLAVLFLVVVVVSLFLNQPGCRESGECAQQVIFWALVITSPIVFLISWGWGRWYHKKALAVTTQLERDYSLKVAEVDLQNKRMVTVMHHLADGVLLLNNRGEIRLINQAACDILDIQENEAMGKLFSSVAWHHQLIELWQTCRESNEEARQSIELEQHNLFLEAIVSPVDRAQNSGGRYLVVLQDLTRIRRLESIRRDFISNVSHELLTPIASVKAVVETLEDGALNDKEAASRFLGRAAVEVDAMTQLVNEVLTLTRIESGATEFRFSAVPVSELLLQPADRFAEQAGRKKIGLVVDIGSDLPMVTADVEQIWQVVRNLLHNAIKHTPQNGEVRLSAKSRSGFVEIAVSDTGAGIHPEDLPRIFERFYKADRARNRGAVSGTGLGLAIAKHIVLAHHGTIWAKSTLGKGSKFFFSIPVVNEKH